jgi:hypothetical protein
MLLTVEGSYRITCPRYPAVQVVPPLWRKLAGRYTEHTRIPSTYSDADVLGEAEIRIVDDVLLLPRLEAALWPVNDGEVILMGGPFDGETMLYDAETGNLAWQDVIYRPVTASPASR